MTIIIWAAALLAGIALFMPAWRRLGPLVLKATESHAIQIIAMLLTLAVLTGVSASILTVLAHAL